MLLGSKLKPTLLVGPFYWCNILLAALVWAKPSQLDARLELHDCDKPNNECLPATLIGPHNRTTAQPRSFITTTSDAIYRALSNVFTQESPDNEMASEFDRDQPYDPIRQQQQQQPKSAVISLLPGSNRTLTGPILPATPKVRPSRPPAPKTTTTTTFRPPVSIETTTTATTTSTAAAAAAVAAHLEDAVGGPQTINGSMDELLDDALRSIFSIRQTMMRNRTTRLAPPHFGDLKLVDLFGSASAGSLAANSSDDQQLAAATREDVHLLCKLLHKRLESASNQTGSVAPPKREGLYVASLRDLNETLDDYLLESVFWLSDDKSNKTNSSSLGAQERGELALLNLFNLAATKTSSSHLSKSQAVANDNVSSKATDYESESDPTSEDTSRIAPLAGPTSRPAPVEGPFVIKSWSSTTRLTKGGQSALKLVYWLAERAGQPQQPLRLLHLKEAQSLLQSGLEQWQVERHLSGLQLKPVAGRGLVSKGSASGGPRSVVEEQPLVLDDSLELPTNQQQVTPTSGSSNPARAKSGLQLLLDRLSESSFVDNLHLYLIMFILALVLIMLCFAIPMICCKRRQSAQSHDEHPRPAGRLARRRNQKRPARHNIAGADEIATISGGKSTNPLLSLADDQVERNLRERDEQVAKLRQQSDAIWRKLSNTTTTLIKDESVLVRNDTPFGDHFEGPKGRAFGRESPDQLFEWYPFHSGGERQSHERTHKSVQTNESQLMKQHQQAAASASNMGDSQETWPMTVRSRSDTMSKSELVMLKEKMIPIMQEKRQQQQQSQQVAATQTSLDGHRTGGHDDYVNQSQMDAAVARPQQTEPQASSSSSNDNDTNGASPRRAAQLEDCISSIPSRHIDSSESRSSGLEHLRQPTSRRQQQQQQQQQYQFQEHQRQPTMRRLELPAKTRSKVEAIRSELERLEQRDPASTYKRYDVI